MVNPPRYFSRLMQTLKPAFDQLTASKCWGAITWWSRIVGKSLPANRNYVPERKVLLSPIPWVRGNLNRACSQSKLEKAGFSEKMARQCTQQAEVPREFST